MFDAATAFEAILNAPGFRARLGTALGYLARRWPDLDHDFCRTGGSADAIEAMFAPKRLPATVGDIDDMTLRWLRRQRPPSDDLILAYLLIVDSLIAPFGRSRAVEALEGAFTTGVEPVHIWIAPRGILHDIAAAENKAPLGKPNTNYIRPLDDHFSWLRHARVMAGRRFRVESVDDETQQALEKLAKLAQTQSLRVGLYSLRGGFEPRFAYSRTSTGGGGQWHLFLAHEIEPEGDYVARIRSAVHEASDPEKPMHILVFPEFLMTEPGVKALRDALAATAREKRDRPLLIFAGSAHVQRKDGKWVNSCTVFDQSGREIPGWRQWKQVPFGDEESDALLRAKVNGLPAGATGTVRLIEDIERDGEYLIGRTPLGSFGIAICADVVINSDESPLLTWTAAPVDWVVIPAYTPATRRFYEAASVLIRSLKVVLFANAYAAIPQPLRAGVAGKEIPSPLSGGSGPVLGSFISTPWTDTIGVWFSDPGDARATKKPYWAVPKDDPVDGLGIDLASFLRL